MMRIAVWGVALAALWSSLTWFTVLADEGREHGQMACRPSIVGTYLTTIEDSAGAFASRSVITLHADGTVAVVDARESSGVTGDAFSSQLGSYGCSRRHRAVATTIDFGFPPNQDIGRFDWTITIRRDRTIAGHVTLNLFSPLATCNPFEPDDTCTRQAQFDFSFTSVRVPSRLAPLRPQVSSP